MTDVLIAVMTQSYAADIVTWRYPPPYDCYDMTSADPAFIADPASGFFALLDTGTLPDTGTLIGFRSFGADGQVPGGSYDSAALDTGGGLRPELTGQGLGRVAITTGLNFGRQEFAPEAMEELIRSAGRIPRQRTTLYEDAPAERRFASLGAAPLAEPWNPPVKDAGLVAPARLVRPGFATARI